MSIFQLVFKITFLSIILLSFSCSSINQNTETQNLEVSKVEPLQMANQSWNEIETESGILANGNEAQESSDWKKIELIPGEQGELTTAKIFQERNMNGYEQGGFFYCGSSGLAKDKPQIKCNKSKIRHFIWKHWIDKTRGYIRFTYDGIDVAFTEHVFVEPNNKGVWKIDWKVIRQEGIDGSINEVEINFVERIESKSGKNNWELMFKNNNGDIIRTL